MTQRLIPNWIIYLAAVAAGALIASLAFGQGRYVLPCTQRLAKARMDSLATFIGVTEATGRNDGRVIKIILSHVHLPEGYPYCAAGTVISFDTALIVGEVLPILRSAGAVPIFNDAKRRGKRSPVDFPKVGDAVAWQHPTGTAGHIAAGVLATKYPFFQDVEFNTSSGDKGSQRDGGGVYRRIRKYAKLGTMKLLGCIGFTK